MRRTVIISTVIVLLVLFVTSRLTTPRTPTALHREQFTRGECTWYVYQRTQDFGWRVKFDQAYGRHGRAWWERVVNAMKGQTPCEHSIMVIDAWPGNPYGHVAFVERVKSSDRWVISHANWRLGVEREQRVGVPVFEAGVERVSGGVRIAGLPHVFRLRGFLAPLQMTHVSQYKPTGGAIN
jgi:surface antigen